MKLYGGIDLHSTNSYVVLLDELGAIQYKRRLPNDIGNMLLELKKFEQVDSLVVESTYNWYWLVDGLMEAGYKVKLANPNAIQQYNGLKHCNDKTDARWLAELNRLDILPTGYIYPKETRGLRDLLRKRLQLVQGHTKHLLSIQTIVERNTSIRLTSNKIKQLSEEELKNYLECPHVFQAALSNFAVMKCLAAQIKGLEKIILTEVKKRPGFIQLQTIDGIGKVLAETILLETGEVKRFSSAGNYASYCRCVGSKKESNGKKKGENNRKNGNRYLCWAYVEAANFAIRYNDTIKAYYQRKTKRTNSVVAIKTIANKLARACYFILRDEVDFDVQMTFAK